jgi:CPA1 family monovalent cation:H+ antiporter
MGTADEPLIETTLTFVGAYGAYYTADLIGGSGILAATASGLVMGNYGLLSNRYVTARGREIVEALWEFVAFIANALVFLLMGFSLARIPLHTMVWPVAAGILCGLVSRACAVYISSSLVSHTSSKVPMHVQHLLVWGGQRGALSLVMAVAVFGAAPEGNQLIAATAGLVAFSILCQGLTFQPLLKRLQSRASQ